MIIDIDNLQPEDWEMDNEDGTYVGCLVTLVAIFLIVFLLGHWAQIDARLAHLLGLQ